MLKKMAVVLEIEYDDDDGSTPDEWDYATLLDLDDPDKVKVLNVPFMEDMLCVRESAHFPNETNTGEAHRFIVPHSNPREYEEPLDALFDVDQPEMAKYYANSFGDNEETLHLCRLILIPVEKIVVNKTDIDEVEL